MASAAAATRNTRMPVNGPYQVSTGNVRDLTSNAAGRVTDVDRPPTNGERTIYVSDDGMLDTGEYDQLTAEFRYRLGLLPNEQQELSEVFKVRIGLATDDCDQFKRLADEIDQAIADGDKRREETMRNNKMELFARKYFQPGSPPLQYTQEPLKRPLLTKSNDAEKRASLALWLAIKRFIDGTSQRRASSAGKGLEAPIISLVWDQLETIPTTVTAIDNTRLSTKRRGSGSSSADINSASGRKSISGSSSFTSSSKRLSLRKLFRTHSSAPATSGSGADFIRGSLSRTQSATSSASSSSSETVPPSADRGPDDVEDNTRLLTSDIVESIPTTELDLVNYIVAHGILRQQLRDEIFCQLCCQVTKNPSSDSRRRGWILHSLCAGCFLPSIELFSYYYGFLYDVLLSDTLHYAAYTRRILHRTNMNGMRFHPPNSIELKALKDQKALILEVGTADGRHVLIEGDSATTSSEVCDSIANMLHIKDSFGFALFINIGGKISSLGSGLDHVMDAITECEQLVRSQGRLESTASWKLFYHKELFTPWYNPSIDMVGTELIFRQIINGVQKDEYKLHTDDVCTFVSRCLYVDHGRQLQLDVVKSKMADFCPKSFLAINNKSRDVVAKAIMGAFENQGFSSYAVPAKFIQQEIVASASTIWPTHFSAMFEGYRVDGPPLQQNEVVIAINSGGVFLLDNKYDVMVGFHYYDLMEAITVRSAESRQICIKLTAVDGAEFSFLSPNAETVVRIISAFLEGLRRRSHWAVATQPYESRGAAGVHMDMKTGDLVELTGSLPSTSRDEEWFKGRNERTGDRGKFPSSCVYILPSIDKPATEFLGMMTSLAHNMAAETASSPALVEHLTPVLPTAVGVTIQQNNDDDNEHGTESTA